MSKGVAVTVGQAIGVGQDRVRDVSKVRVVRVEQGRAVTGQLGLSKGRAVPVGQR